MLAWRRLFSTPGAPLSAIRRLRVRRRRQGRLRLPPSMTPSEISVGEGTTPRTFTITFTNQSAAPVNPAALAALAGGVLLRGVYGGSFVATGGGATYRVPYAGFIGDYQTIQVLGPGGCARSPLPGIFRLGGSRLCAAATATTPAVTLDVPATRQADGAVFLVESREDRPVILYQRAHQSV